MTRSSADAVGRPGRQRLWLGIGALVVLAAGVVLWRTLLSEDRSDVAPVATTESTAGSAESRPAADVASPSLPVVTANERRTPPTGSAGTREYDIEGTRVRDHRGGDRPPIDLPPNIHPPDSRRIDASLTGDLTAKMRAVMVECAANVPPEARGDKPRLEGVIVIAIQKGQATVTKSTMQLRNVVGASVEPTKQCIEQKSIGLVTPAAGEADLESYSINLTFAFP